MWMCVDVDVDGAVAVAVAVSIAITVAVPVGVICWTCRAGAGIHICWHENLEMFHSGGVPLPVRTAEDLLD